MSTKVDEILTGFMFNGIAFLMKDVRREGTEEVLFVSCTFTFERDRDGMKCKGEIETQFIVDGIFTILFQCWNIENKENKI